MGLTKRMRSFQKPNEEPTAVRRPKAFFSPLSARSSWAPLTSWWSTSPLRHRRVAPSPPPGRPDTCCSLPNTVTAPSDLKRHADDKACADINEAGHLMHAELR